MNVYDLLGGRKATMALLALAIGTTVVLVKGDISVAFASFLVGVVGLFAAGNVAADHIAANAAGDEEPAPVQPPAPTIDMAPLEAHLGEVSASVSTVQQALSLIIRRTGIDKMPEPPQS